MARPESGNLSVIVQGPIARDTAPEYPEGLTCHVLARIRKILPEAEIIVSTWAGENFSDPNCRIILESKDPGGVRLRDCPLVKSNNVNRQIVSTLAGLRRATRPYAVKLRTDMILDGCGFLDLPAAFPERSAELRLFRERVAASTVYSINPRSFFVHPFHPSDWMYFGLTEDLLALWDIPLAPEPETTLWFETRPKPPLDFMLGDTRRYTPEQYIWQAFLRKHMDLAFDHKTDVSGDNLRLSELSLANNLVLASPEQLGFRFPKYRIRFSERPALYSHGDWQHLYRTCCAPGFRGASGLPLHLKGCVGGALRTVKLRCRPLFDWWYRRHARWLAKTREKRA